MLNDFDGAVVGVLDSLMDFKPAQAMPSRIRILFADDHEIVREGIAAVLGQEPDLNFVGFAENGRRACEEFERLHPDVLVLDLRMPEQNGLDVLRHLVRKFQARVVVLTTFENEEDLKQSLKAGAKGYLLKEAEREEIADAIRTVARGGHYLPARLAREVASFAYRNELSDRELEVLRLVCKGISNKLIGSELGITEGTVKKHVKGIFRKLRVISRAEAVSQAILRGLVQPGS